MDLLLTVISFAVQAALVAWLLVLSLRSSTHRNIAVVTLGAISPLLAFYAGTTIAFFIDPSVPDVGFAFHAMWVMCVVPFFGFAGLGAVVSHIPYPRHQALRYLMGASFTLLAIGLMWGVGSIS